MLPHLLPLIPEHVTYCEPFCGGAALFFAKPKSQVEIINDLNGEVINFYRQCQTNFDALQTLIQSTPHSRRLHKDAIVMYQHPHLFSPLDRAWAFYTATNQGYLGKICSWGFGTIDASCEKKLDNSRERFADQMRDRLNLVQIECTDALRLLERRDRPTTFFYLDPPYYNSDCGHYGGYKLEDFEKLLQACSRVKGKFLLSSYPSEILTRYAEQFGWHQVAFQQKTKASKTRKLKVEVLTANYPI